MNFDEAVRTHCLWKMHLLGIIAGTVTESLDPHVIEADDKCALGIWIHGDAQKYKDLEAYQILLKEHATFHEKIGKAVTLVNDGLFDQAKSYLETSKFNDASKRIIDAIRSLQQAVPAT